MQFRQGRIDEIKQRDKVIQLICGEPLGIIISQFIEPEERRHITTGKDGYRILEEVRIAILISGDSFNERLEAHVLVGSIREGEIGYSCWAIQQKGLRSWIRAGFMKQDFYTD